MKTQLRHILAVTAIMISMPVLALATCSISGSVTASANPDPLGPDWMYTVVIDWNTGSQYALSHMDMWLDVAGGTCSCQDFQQAISYAAIIGSSGASCVTSYTGSLNCQGDPSIPHVDGIVLKFEPTAQSCEPGTTGQGTFVFFSELGPAPIDEEALTLVDKFARQYCFGSLTGDFPSMPCDPVGAGSANWGSVKGMFR